MAIVLPVNQNFHWSLLHVFLITLFIFSSSQSGTFIVVNNMKDNPSHNTDYSITPSQNIDALSKIKRTEYQSYVNHSGESFDGFNIFQIRDFVNQQYIFQITDMDGNIIDEFPSKSNYGYAQQVNSTTFQLVSSAPSYFWNIETGKYQSLNLSSHHDISYNPETKTFMTLTTETILDYIDFYRYDIIHERNMDGNPIWTLNTSSFIPFDWWSGETVKTKRDITHSNSVF